MGEIYQAYQTLNRMLKLGLSKAQILAAEAQFKIDLADRLKFPDPITKDPMRLSAEWEVMGTLTPRRRALKTLTKQSLEQLKAEALQQAGKKPGK